MPLRSFRPVVLALAASLACAAPSSTPSTPAPALATGTADEQARWRATAARVTITRDDWGIAHVKGASDADAVFGMMYAQAEDDFNRVETNYLNSLGRLAEAEGEREIWRDLRQKLFIDPADMRAKYAASPAWLRALMDAYADGLNYYLATHPEVKPRVITRFEPWMALSFSEGSIGGDIEKVSLAQLEALYGAQRTGAAPSATQRVALAAEDPDVFREPSGSNGIAIAPSNTVNGRALLLINPHTSFFFRSELKVESDEGLDAYGAVTWGQFFIYQGFNRTTGWMHTTSGADAVDEFAETITPAGSGYTYKYGAEQRPVTVKSITVPYRTAGGAMASRTFTTYATHHGPIVREADGKWIAIALMQRPVEALQQSFLRTRQRDLKGFREVMNLAANSSNNTIYSDADGNIAYFHPQFVPVRDDRFDFTRVVDGSDPATDWKGVHTVESMPYLLNPRTGWIQNTNNWPYSAAGPVSPRREDFPKYMDAAGENPRGIHALRVLADRKDFDIQQLIAAAYDSYLPAFAQMIPPLISAWDAAPAGELKTRLAEPVAALRAWDYRWGAASVPTALAVFWGEDMWSRYAADARRAGMPAYDYMATRVSHEQRLTSLAAAVDRLNRDFGTWRTPWGEINRFQRISSAIVHPFSDAAPSIPVPFTSAQWGSLASFGARTYPGTKRMYGTSGNSFVAVVEFGRDSVRARAVSAGGESGKVGDRHFNDQAARYAAGDLRPVYFYANQLVGHTERTYHP